MKSLKKKATVRTCRVCGCTDIQACEGGCYWVEVDLCSSCVEFTPAYVQFEIKAKAVSE